MPTLGWIRLPWRFRDEQSEQAFYAVRNSNWASGPDQLVAVPWSLLWISIIARHWAALSWQAIMRSSFHFIIICGPAYLPYVLGRRRYERNRTYFVIAALISYVLHPGGGLYRDAVMSNVAEHTGLDAFSLFVRLLIGSRTLFWLVLVFGYELPPEIGVPVNAACLLTMGRLRPSEPFCATMQTAATRPLFHLIASSLPLVTSISLDHPQLAMEADICNPLLRWLQFSLAFLLPALVHMAGDYAARITFVRQHPQRMSPRDRAEWQAKLDASFTPWPVAGMLFVGIIAVMWYAFIWPQMLPVGSPSLELLQH